MAKKKRMNLPNILTVCRMAAVIVLVVIALLTWDKDIPNFAHEWLRLTICGLFIVASVTDFLDGHIARKRNIVTTFGKFMDPIADKLLVNSTFIILTAWGVVPIIVTLLIIARDLIVDAIRMVMVQHNVVIAASIWGKLKTICQMICIPTILLAPSIDALLGSGEFFWIIGQVMCYVCAAVSLFSGVDYFWKNRKTILDGALEEYDD